MENQIEEFVVKELYGTSTFRLRFVDNTLIFVGENGSGKTTLLRMLFYFLAGRWASLLQFKFSSVSATIGGVTHTISHEELVGAFRVHDRQLLARIPPSVRERLVELIERGDVDRIPSELERVGRRYGIGTASFIREIMGQLGDLGGERPAQKKLQSVIEEIHKSIGHQILYLPTYRRIERELNSIFEGADTDDLRKYRQRQLEGERSYIELVEFGMRDVQTAINDVLGALKDFLLTHLSQPVLAASNRPAHV